ncbi:MAG TPA: glycoside hydrolase family 13 protein [Candidatus Limnocylindrales bacterium]
MTVMNGRWIENAVIYQVYPRSFADGSGDGVGDIAGIRARLPYLRELGIDAIWLSPWYVSPMADAGYDVADYRDIDPLFGSLDAGVQLINEAHALGLKVILDIVPNHCSDRHPLFQAALAAGPGSPEREYFWFRDEPPNDWQSHFGGPAWTKVPDGQYYLHMFAPEQPDWNWEHPLVRKEFEQTLRFWFDLGVDGFRIDVADHLVKDLDTPGGYFNQEGVHEIYRSWRSIADGYPRKRIFVGELWDPDFTSYLRADELHTGFNFAFLSCPWDPGLIREIITTTLDTHAEIGAPPTWVLSNHDVVRHVTRYGRTDTGHYWIPDLDGSNADLALGTRRARAAVLLTMSLPGCAYVYQGEELGLPEVEDIPFALLQDPRWMRSGGTDRGRDGCRVPLPWSGSAPPFGFSADGVAPWLPQPQSWAQLTAEAQDGDAKSMLELYRTALRLRRTWTSEQPLGRQTAGGVAVGGVAASEQVVGGAAVGGLSWVELGEAVIAFRRGDLMCLVNFGGEPVALPAGGEVVLSSVRVTDSVPSDAAVWVRLPD